MIRKPTVFVLGAGASHPYGFPLGRGLLVQTVKDLNNPSSNLVKILKGLAHDDQELSYFGRQLGESSQPSIDRFIELRGEFRQIGKRAIAFAIAQAEIPENLYKDRETSWYEHLFAMLTEDGCVDITQQSISFITFNYDRSLEYFIHQSLKACAVPDKLARDQIMQVITHVWGSLGPYPKYRYEDFIRDGKVELASKCGMLNERTESLLIMNESLGTDAPIAQARKLLGEAELVVFLGFGFHRGNLEALGISPSWRDKTVIGSSYGMGDIAVKKVEKLFSDVIPNKSHPILLYPNNVYDLFRTRIPI